VALTNQSPYVCAPGLYALQNGGTIPGYCSYLYAQALSAPRSMIRAPNGDLIVIESGAGRITALWDSNQDGISDELERVTLSTVSDGLYHGLVLGSGYIYASNQKTVYRWPYQNGTRADLGYPQVVVGNMPQGGYMERPLALDSYGNLYVAVASATNVDPNTTRTVVKIFMMPSQVGSDWSDGQIVVSGLRRTTGLRFDANGNLWGVDNGVEDLTQNGVDIHNDNPSDEINLLTNNTVNGTLNFYGYPYCWSEYRLVGGLGPGTQWVQSDFQSDGIHSNSWCQNQSNVIPPALAMPAHVAPMDILFYYGNNFPHVDSGDAFVTWYGSTDRSPPSGFKVVHITYINGSPKNLEPFLFMGGNGYVEGETDSDTGSGWPYNPVSVANAPCAVGTRGECLFVSSDSTNNIIAVSWVSPGGEGDY